MIVREFAENGKTKKIKIYDMKYEIFKPFGQVLGTELIDSDHRFGFLRKFCSYLAWAIKEILP